MHFFPNHALESDDKEESEYASPIMMQLCLSLSIISAIIVSRGYYMMI